MSDVKMSEVLSNETIENFGNIVCAVGGDDLGTFNTARQAEYAAHAISTHDTMQARIDELVFSLDDRDCYIADADMKNAELTARNAELEAALIYSIDIIKSISDDPEVLNVHKCHLNQSDIDYLAKALKDNS